jgi:hypothetical protein
MKFDSWPKSRIAAPAILVLATALVFGRVVGFGWTEWDDTVNVTKNPGLNPITPASLWSFWRTPYEGLYIPVSYCLFAAEVAISRAMFPGPALDPRQPAADRAHRVHHRAGHHGADQHDDGYEFARSECERAV